MRPTCAIHNTENEIDDGAYFCVECDDDGVQDIAVPVCRRCREGAPGECHTPGCAFWMHAAPNRDLRELLSVCWERTYEGPFASSQVGEPS